MIGPSGYDRRRSNAGFRLGLVGGLVVGGSNAVLGFMLQNWNTADLIAWFFGWVVVFIVARQAAEQQYRVQRNELEPGRHVRGAAVGAALITVLLVWLFIFGRDVVRDQPGLFTVFSCARVPFDILLALGIGSLAAAGFSRGHQSENSFFQE
jgi:uncharacterized membrane protein YfcA